MNASLATRRFALAAVLVAAFASVAAAEEMFADGQGFTGYAPSHYIIPNALNLSNPAVPLLGFQGQDTPWGLAVETVSLGSNAQRIGLESGDVIVALNGRPVRNYVEYRRALAQSGGVVRLLVRDVRSGNVVQMPVVNLYQPVMNGGACAAVEGL